MNYEYIAEGFLEEGTSTYVERKADGELHAGLKAGQFCYVFNARKTGKTSLQVKVQSTLEKQGFACVVIDLQGKDTYETSLEKWYNGLLKDITKELKLEVNLSNWIKDNSWLSPLDRFSEFIESVLLKQISKTIVIFIDEIDSVHSLKFPIDDFFAFIRSCYNRRGSNPDYNRLSFCLLGVASPSDLIKDKQRTPFNIGKAIFLEGFKWSEVEPLLKGLEDKFGNVKAEAVMREILSWTEGQPFLTQKLCKFMVEESEDYPRSVEEVVRARIIENWVSQDNPEHLRTIRDRILVNERQASDLLKLYQQILQSREIDSNNSIEVSQLCLSGLVVKLQERLKVNNPIYKEIFDKKWIETQLRKLCPYAENLQAWERSGYKDKSRLLKGETLQEAQEWSKDKELSNLHTQFLSASEIQERKAEIDFLEIAAKLKRETKDRLVAEQANKRMRFGTMIFGLTVAVAGIVAAIVVGFVGFHYNRTDEYVNNLSHLAELSGKLEKARKRKEADEARKMLTLSTAQEIKDNHNLYQALFLSAIALAHQNLGDSAMAIERIEDSRKRLRSGNIQNSRQGKEVLIYFLEKQGKINKIQENQTTAIKAYKEAFNLLQSNNNQLEFLNLESELNASDSLNLIEAVHYELIDLLKSKSAQNNDLLSKVKKSQKEYYYTELDNLLKNKSWQEADDLTAKFIWQLAGTWQERSFPAEVSRNFPCEDLRKIDDLWTRYSDNRFGFSVQKSIWHSSEVNKDLTKFLSRVRWWRSEYNIISFIPVTDFSLTAPKGQLPWLLTWEGSDGIRDRTAYMSRIASCTYEQDPTPVSTE